MRRHLKHVFAPVALDFAQIADTLDRMTRDQRIEARRNLIDSLHGSGQLTAAQAHSLNTQQVERDYAELKLVHALAAPGHPLSDDQMAQIRRHAAIFLRAYFDSTGRVDKFLPHDFLFARGTVAIPSAPVYEEIFSYATERDQGDAAQMKFDTLKLKGFLPESYEPFHAYGLNAHYTDEDTAVSALFKACLLMAAHNRIPDFSIGLSGEVEAHAKNFHDCMARYPNYIEDRRRLARPFELA